MDSMVNQYTIPSINVARNAFVRNHSWKGDCKVGLLYPVFFDEVLPGDTKQLNSTFFGRINPTVTAPLDNVWLDYHLFFVPNRETWDHWPNFLGEKKNPNDSIDYLVPTITAGESGFTPNELIDYLGVPPSVPSLTCSSLIFYLRAYNKIWNEWYRSELYQDSVTEIKGDTGDTESIYKLLPRGKRQDYFTSAFATPQNGVGSSIPLGNVSITGSVPISSNGILTLNSNVNGSKPAGLISTNPSTGNYVYGSVTTFDASAEGNSVHVDGQLKSGKFDFGSTEEQHVSIGYSNPYASSIFNSIRTPNDFGLRYNSGLVGDGQYLTGITSPISINTLRQAVALQQFLERDLFGGSRIVELILSHFGVRVPDYRLDRAEYLGGCTTRVNINPVTQVSSTDATSPQGNISGNGVVSSTSGGFTHSFTEHGVILGLASFRIDQNYQQGVDRHFLRNSRYDYFWPTLAHLGMQGIYNKEIYAQGDAVLEDDNETIIDNELFGYNMRNSEYRFKNSYITGTLRSSHSASLDIWHLAENFEELPKLNSEFIETSDTLQRIMTVQSVPEIILDVWHDFTDVREVPMYGLPGLERI